MNGLPLFTFQTSNLRTKTKIISHIEENEPDSFPFEERGEHANVIAEIGELEN